MSHVRLYQKLVKNQLDVGDDALRTAGKFYANYLMSMAVEQEIKWSKHIIGDDILGMPPHAIEEYIKYLANVRLKAIGLSGLYEEVNNPFKHLESIADTGREATTKTNFFDSTVTSYQMATTLGGWDF